MQRLLRRRSFIRIVGHHASPPEGLLHDFVIIFTRLDRVGCVNHLEMSPLPPFGNVARSGLEVGRREAFAERSVDVGPIYGRGKAEPVVYRAGTTPLGS
jgi:hypothetical protein